MAAAKSKKTSISASTLYKEKPKKSRPGVHSKNNTSKSKNATNYVKAYNGQGK
jgi:hypothetical protein